MLKQLYAVYDLVAETIVGGVIQENQDAPAIRAFADALVNPQSLLGQHPRDFNLMLLGSIVSDGTIVPASGGPVVVATGAALTAVQETEK